MIWKEAEVCVTISCFCPLTDQMPAVPTAESRVKKVISLERSVTLILVIAAVNQ